MLNTLETLKGRNAPYVLDCVIETLHYKLKQALYTEERDVLKKLCEQAETIRKDFKDAPAIDVHIMDGTPVACVCFVALAIMFANCDNDNSYFYNMAGDSVEMLQHLPSRSRQDVEYKVKAVDEYMKPFEQIESVCFNVLKAELLGQWRGFYD